MDLKFVSHMQLPNNMAPANNHICHLLFAPFMYQSNRSFNIPPPPLGIPRAFDVLSCPGGREFD